MAERTSGRCDSCANFEPGAGVEAKGYCSWYGAYFSPEHGCNRWKEGKGLTQRGQGCCSSCRNFEAGSGPLDKGYCSWYKVYYYPDDSCDHWEW